MIEAGWRLLDEGKTGRLSFHPLFSCRNVHLDFDQPLLWEIFMVRKFVVPRFFKAARKSGFHGNMKRQKTREAACCQCRYWLLYQSIELPVAFMNTLDIICRLWAELDKSGKGYVTLEELTSYSNPARNKGPPKPPKFKVQHLEICWSQDIDPEVSFSVLLSSPSFRFFEILGFQVWTMVSTFKVALMKKCPRVLELRRNLM